MTGGTCAVCHAAAGQQCAGCKVVFYCGREHQRAHWTQHRNECRPVRLAEDPVLGRHLVAARNISAGELVLRENYTVLANSYTLEEAANEGPKMMSYPICLGCFRAADLKCACSGCGWPMCSEKCESAQAHKAECAVMQRAGYCANISDSSHKIPDYVCLTPLRILLLPEEKKRKILELQSHVDSRKNTPLYKLLKNNVVGFIRDRLGLADKFSEDEILNICGILDTNAFEVIPKEECLKVRGLYALACMMAHDCRPNTRHVFDSNAAMLVYSTVDIKLGESVTTTYTHTLWGTLARRAHLRRAKCFDCACQRCSDPTEFGTYVGAILCSRCNSQGKDQGKIISTSPLDDAAPWRCTNCSYEMSAKQIEWGNTALKKEIEELEKSGPKYLEDFMEKYKNVLHCTNGHALQVKYALSQIYGGVQQFRLSDLNEQQIERKIEISHELIDAILVLEPGLSRMRGMLLFDLQSAMAMQAKLDFEAERITKERAQEVLGDSMRMLQEATEILKVEPGMEAVLQERLIFLANELEISLDEQTRELEPQIVKPKSKRTPVVNY